MLDEPEQIFYLRFSCMEHEQRRKDDDGLQCLPLLRRVLRRISCHGISANVSALRIEISRKPLSWLRRLLLRLPVCAAPRIWGEPSTDVCQNSHPILWAICLAETIGQNFSKKRPLYAKNRDNFISEIAKFQIFLNKKLSHLIFRQTIALVGRFFATWAVAIFNRAAALLTRAASTWLTHFWSFRKLVLRNYT